MSPRVFVVALASFATAAALGAGFALLGPVTLIRLLGTTALFAGALGCALQVYALHEFAPRTYAALRRRAIALWERSRLAWSGVPAGGDALSGS